ncbi:related to ferric reductase [Ustilago trichophora]|uniref:ferric-chelate reductase (NADPH) n=1 Tax=Ustilago trichophora TaxID=86804 RepID=A0A5C3EPE8_9BASI|nr:related to ferric reductase [Ustilago trichophora]
MQKRHGSPTTAGIGLIQNTRTGDPWAGQPKYSKGIVTTISIIILIFTVISVHSRWRRHQHQRHTAGNHSAYPKAHVSSTSRLARPVAAMRMLAYRRLPPYRLGIINFRLPVLGATLALSAFMLSFTVWTFVVQPYYRVDRSFGSPPLALRSGMMALGLMPFIYMLGSKVNVRGRVPELPLADHGAAGLRDKFFLDNINTTGVVAYACLFVLSFASLTGIRERCYELFLLIHVPVAILFLGYMFVHCQAMLTLWRYLWATAALYMLSVFLRFVTQLQQNGFLLLATCRVEALPSGVAKMTVDSAMRWRPRQHVFVRFPGLVPLSAHPFTIVSMPSPNDQQLVLRVVLMAKARKGLTKRLYDQALQAQADLGLKGNGFALLAILDGPYGQDAGIAGHEQVLLLAGSSGITFVLASLLELSWLWQQNSAATQSVHLVWSMRDALALEWVCQHLVTIAALAPPNAVKVSIYVSERGAASQDLGLPTQWEVQWGIHPDAALAVRDMAREAATCTQGDVDIKKASPRDSSATKERAKCSTSASVVVCGPSGMVHDTSNAVAGLQADIVRGKLDGLQDVSLITESFGF